MFLTVRFPLFAGGGRVALIGSISTDDTAAKDAKVTRRESERRADELLQLQETDRFKTQCVNHVPQASALRRGEGGQPLTGPSGL